MIPLAYITQWRNIAPWADDMQIEQDLILSRAIIEIFSDPMLSQELVFRGGTALHKLFFQPAARYSEDIDLVRTTTGPIKKIVDRLRDRLDSWLGSPKSIRTSNSFKLNYYFIPETATHTRLKVKFEINIRECFSCFETTTKELSVYSNWFESSAMIHTYQFPELIATKLRALYQRKKGRDVFDLWLALRHKDFDLDASLKAFHFYMKQENSVIRRGDFLLNLDSKLKDSSFTNDMLPLLMLEAGPSHNKTSAWNIHQAVAEIKKQIIAKLPD